MSDSEKPLAGTVAFVTGASGALGIAIAEALAAKGARIALAARRLDTLNEVAARLAGAGADAFAVSCDVADWASVASAVQVAQERFGRIDHLINNAGTIDPIGALHAADPDAWARNIDVNIAGAFRCCKAVLPAMLATRRGTIVNISSGAASRALEGWSAYCAGKAGLAMLTRSLIEEYGPAGLRVHGFVPGAVATDMQVKIRASGINPVSRIDPKALTPPEYPARLVAFLCSPEIRRHRQWRAIDPRPRAPGPDRLARARKLVTP